MRAKSAFVYCTLLFGKRYCRLLGRLTVPSVQPSFLADVTLLIPMDPPAPGTLTTWNLTPALFDIASASRRAHMSVAPPAVWPTMIWIVLWQSLKYVAAASLLPGLVAPPLPFVLAVAPPQPATSRHKVRLAQNRFTLISNQTCGGFRAEFRHGSLAGGIASAGVCVRLDTEVWTTIVFRSRGRRDSPKVLAKCGACLTEEVLAKPGSCLGRCSVLGGWVNGCRWRHVMRSRRSDETHLKCSRSAARASRKKCSRNLGPASGAAVCLGDGSTVVDGDTS